MKKSKKTINRIKKKTYKKSEYKKKTYKKGEYKKGEYKKRVKRILRGGETKKNNKKPPIQITQNNIEKKKRDSFTSNWFVHSDIFSSPILIENRIARDIYQDLSEAEKKIVERKSKVEKIQLSKSNTKNSLSSAISDGYSKGRTQANRFKGSMQSMGDSFGSALGQKIGRTSSDIYKQGTDAFSSKGSATKSGSATRSGSATKSGSATTRTDIPPTVGNGGQIKTNLPPLPKESSLSGDFEATDSNAFKIGTDGVDKLPKEEKKCSCCNEGPNVEKDLIFKALKGMIQPEDSTEIEKMLNKVKPTVVKSNKKKTKKEKAEAEAEAEKYKEISKTLLGNDYDGNMTPLLIKKLDKLDDLNKYSFKKNFLNKYNKRIIENMDEKITLETFTELIDGLIKISKAGEKAASAARTTAEEKAAREIDKNRKKKDKEILAQKTKFMKECNTSKLSPGEANELWEQKKPKNEVEN